MDYRNQTIELTNNGLDFLNRQVDGEKFQTAEWIDPDAQYPGLIGSLDVTTSKAASAIPWADLLPGISGANSPIVMVKSSAAGLIEAHPLSATAQYDFGFTTGATFPGAVDIAMPTGQRLKFLSTHTIDSGTVGRTATALASFTAVSAGAATVTAATVSATAGILSNVTAGMPNYQWRATYYNSLTGQETPASAATAAPLALSTQAADVVVTVPAALAWNTLAKVLAKGYDTVRLYRKGGAVVDGYRLSQSMTNPGGAGTTVTFIDASATAGLGDIALSVAPKLDEEAFWAFAGINTASTVDPATTSWTLLATPTITGLFGAFKGSMVFALDSAFPQRVYWSSLRTPFLWNPKTNYVNVCGPEESVKAGVVYNGVPYVFTESNCYALDFGGVNALPMFKPRITSIGLGVLNRKSAISIGPNGVILINQSGIYITDCESEVEKISDKGIQNYFTLGTTPPLSGLNGNQGLDITSEIYDPTQIAESVAFSRGKLYLVLPTKRRWYLSAPFNGTLPARRAFCYSPTRQTWSYLAFDTSTVEITAFLADSSGTEEYLWCLMNGETNGTQIWGSIGVLSPSFGVPARKYTNKLGATATETPYFKLVSSELSMGIPTTYKEFSSALLDLHVEPWEGGTAPIVTVGGAAVTLTAAGRQRTLHNIATSFAETKSYDVSVQHQRAILYNLTLMYREDEEALRNWEIPPTSNGLPGWHYYKGAFISLRSSDIVQLTVQADEQTADVYEIASTAGVKKRVYVPFLPKKGKIWNFKFATKSPATTPFRLYGEDSEFLVKGWGARGWQPVNPLTASGYAGFMRKGGGT